MRCISALKKKPTNEDAKDLLLNLGKCHDLFRRVLTLLIEGKCWAYIVLTWRFCQDVMLCLTPAPTDVITNKLRHCARHCVKVRRESIASSPTATPTGMLATLDSLAEMLSEETWRNAAFLKIPHLRWQAIKDITDDSIIYDQSILAKDAMKSFRRGDGLLALEMCANCFQVETDTCKLKHCSRCKQLTYCGPECQREHWKKAHKRSCQKPW